MGKALGQTVNRNGIPVHQGNRGRSLEEAVNLTNLGYRAKRWAVIDKVATPVKVLNRSGNRITGYFESPSTVDYHGVYRGRSLVFEAKSTKESSRFPFDNIHPHQIEYLRDAEREGAIAFLLVEFAKHDQTFLVPAGYVIECWDRAQQGERKSIPYEAIQTVGTRVITGRGVALDYLAVVDKHWHINEPKER